MQPFNDSTIPICGCRPTTTLRDRNALITGVFGLWRLMAAMAANSKLSKPPEVLIREGRNGKGWDLR
jgi:hypothetical protein